MTLELYITRRFLRAILVVILVIGGLSFLLTSVENIRITAANDAPVNAALVLTLFQLPEIMGETFPLILMLGALAAFLGLSRTSEMVIVRASGISGLRVLLMPVIAALVMGGIATTIYNPIVAASSATADAMKARITQSEQSVLSFAGGSLWLRQGLPSGQTVIQASEASAEGSALKGVRLHQFAPDNRLTTRVEADGAQLGDEVWVLNGVRRWNLDLGEEASLGPAEQLPQLRLPTNLTAEQIQDSFAPPNSIPIWELPDFIAQLEQAGFSATRHRVFLQSELARPALFVAMVLIGAGFSLRHVRFGQTGVMILFAIFAGFSLYFFKDIAETLGGNGDIPVALAAWSAPVAAILLALGLLLHLEDG
ncbi:LPS export ABC transporter permease LptG [Oceanibium sediminis]|uniref:LPS export ABC transporter permease LptG n=1 Tax=Oceanibium sediminis TaxID=2026339 RepID=UPI000DD3E29A|nr:LPS export ABC transporter permease LptG [Oceanibium sediminis]